MIYLTGIGSFELFVTKFFSGMLLASNELLALVPFIALPFLSGGVSLHLLLARLGESSFPWALIEIAPFAELIVQ